MRIGVGGRKLRRPPWWLIITLAGLAGVVSLYSGVVTGASVANVMGTMLVAALTLGLMGFIVAFVFSIILQTAKRSVKNYKISLPVMAVGGFGVFVIYQSSPVGGIIAGAIIALLWVLVTDQLMDD